MELKRLWNGIKIINKIWTRATTYLKKQNSINAINKYMATKKKKILITGASGFIGRNIFEKLSQREDLDVWGTYLTDESFKDGPKMLRADLTQKSEVYKIMQGVDVLIQGAATTSGAKDTFNKPYYHVTDNAIINAILYQAAHECSVSQAIFFSCTTIYPNLDRPVIEGDVDLVGGIYAKYFGEGKEERDLLYISDLVDFVEIVLDKQDYAFDIFNLGLERGISVRDLVKKIIEISGKNLNIHFDTAKPSIATKLVVDCSKAKKKFGWSQKITLDEGIKRTIDWYKTNITNK